MEIHSRTIFESHLHKLYNIFEDVYISDKLTGTVTHIISCHGGPSAGIIDQHNRCCIISGESLILWNMSKKTPECINGFKWIYALRQTQKDIVQILTDPWSQESAIWELETSTMNLSRIREFDDYKNQEYTEMVIW